MATRAAIAQRLQQRLERRNTRLPFAALSTGLAGVVADALPSECDADQRA